MEKASSRVERRLLRIAHQLKARSRRVSLLYLDSFQGNRLGLSAETEYGFVGLHIDRSQKRSGIELISTSSSSVSALAADLDELHRALPRKQMKTRQFVKRVRELSVELSNAFEEGARRFPREQLDRLLGLFPEALLAIGLVSGGQTGRHRADHSAFHGAFIPAGEVGIFAVFDASHGGFRFSRGASILVAESLAGHSVADLGGYGVILDDELVLQPREDGVNGFVDNVIVGVGGEVVDGAVAVASAPVDAALDAVDLGMVDGWDCIPDCDCLPDCGCDVPCA